MIRKAAMESKVIKADFFSLREYPLNPLEKALLDRISEGTAGETGIRELFGVKEVPLHIESIRNCYGAPNEAESILEDVYSGKQLDQCTVAVTDGVTYGQLFWDLAIRYDIPMTFGCGIPIINSNPARLTALYYNWITGGFFGAAEVLRTDLQPVLHTGFRPSPGPGPCTAGRIQPARISGSLKSSEADQ